MQLPLIALPILRAPGWPIEPGLYELLMLIRGTRAMQMALKKAGLNPSDIDYINAHGTSTPLGDELELGAVRRLFGNAIETVSMSSTSVPPSSASRRTVGSSVAKS